LTSFIKKSLVENRSLIFFDEVQECLEVRTAIKFLVDDGRYDYIESGSFLGLSYNNVKSYAVGYEEICTMYPMDFEEFAIANGIQKSTLEILKDCYINRKEVDSFIHSQMIKLFQYFTIVGGMPACVQEFVNYKDMGRVLKMQRAIVELYKKDIGKYSNSKRKISDIFDSIPSELNAKNKRFVLADISKTARTGRYESGFNWLSDAGVALPCYNLEEVKQPVAINKIRNLFKFFMNDCGLLCAMCSNDIQYQIINDNMDINEGSILENVFAKELKSNGFNLYYYDKKKTGEIDFVVEQCSNLIPIEIKSGKNYKSHASLNKLLDIDQYKLKHSIVFSTGNVEVADKIIYLPLYMIMFFKKEDNIDKIGKDFVLKV